VRPVIRQSRTRAKLGGSRSKAAVDLTSMPDLAPTIDDDRAVHEDAHTHHRTGNELRGKKEFDRSTPDALLFFFFSCASSDRPSRWRRAPGLHGDRAAGQSCATRGGGNRDDHEHPPYRHAFGVLDHACRACGFSIPAGLAQGPIRTTGTRLDNARRKRPSHLKLLTCVHGACTELGPQVLVAVLPGGLGAAALHWAGETGDAAAHRPAAGCRRDVDYFAGTRYLVNDAIRSRRRGCSPFSPTTSQEAAIQFALGSMMPSAARSTAAIAIHTEITKHREAAGASRRSSR